MEADVAHERGEHVRVVRDFAVVDVIRDDVAKDAAEVFVAGEGEKTARVGEHTHEAGEEAELGEGIDLPGHAFFLVEEPPAGAVLDFARDGAVLEVAAHGGEEVVVGGVEVVEDDAREFVGGVEGVEIPGKAAGMGEVADGVEAGIWAEGGKHARVVVA